MCNFHHGISFGINSGDYFEGFGFGIKSNTSIGINLLLNNIAMLEKFCLYFTRIASGLIERCYNDRIVMPKSRYLIYNKDDLDIIESCRRNLVNTYYDGKKNKSSLIHHLFSQRELDCIKYLLQGKTMREIGEKLFISPRTAESHMENIKNKLGCNRKSDVISKLLKSNLASEMLCDFL